MTAMTERLAANLASVRDRVDAAARRGGRTGADITLVAVTKYVDAEVARALVQLGCHDLGESRPQELWHKAEACPDPAIRWHLVGHLQRNKAARTLRHTTCIHSVDSIRLLEELDRQAAAAASHPVSVLLEVNISGDASKHGFPPDAVEAALPAAAACSHLQVRGLMTMASREGDLRSARDDFRRLRELRDRLRQEADSGLTLSELSMGMSGDFEVAIEEGATCVRIGSILFEGIA